jgi:pyridoxamine 5'-phosphate oxidase-like protein
MTQEVTDMSTREPIESSRIDTYDLEPMPWSRARQQLEAASRPNGSEADAHRSFWLATVRPDGRPHATAFGGVWVDDRVYLVSGPGTRKSRNLAANPACVVTVSLDDLDLVIEGSARRVTDVPTLEKLAGRYRDQGWPAKVEGEAFTAPYSAPSAGPPPWYVYEIVPVTAFGVSTVEPGGAMRWRFED